MKDFFVFTPKPVLSKLQKTEKRRSELNSPRIKLIGASGEEINREFEYIVPTSPIPPIMIPCMRKRDSRVSGIVIGVSGKIYKKKTLLFTAMYRDDPELYARPLPFFVDRWTIFRYSGRDHVSGKLTNSVPVPSR